MRQHPHFRSYLIEAAAVLSGILAAFGLDAAWGVRQDAIRSAAYVSALSAELESNRRLVEASLAEFAEDRLQLQGFFNDVVAADEATQVEILEMVREVGPQRSVIERVVLSDLLNSGGMDSFRDPEIRRAIGEYELWLASLMDARERLALHWENVMSPYFTEHASLPGMFNSMGTMFGGYQFPADRFRFDEDAFVGNRDFANRYGTYLYRREVVRGSEERFLTSINSLLERLASR